MGFNSAFKGLSIQHATRMHHIVIHGLSGSTSFFHIFFIKGMIFEEKNVEHKMCVLIFSTTLV